MRPLAVLALCGALAACDARLGPDDGPTRIRFVHAAPDALGLLQFTLPQGPAAALQRGASSGYLEVVPRQYALQIHDESELWSVGGDIEVVAGLYQTLVAFGTDGDEAAILLADEPGLPRAGSAAVRFVQLAPFLNGLIDVHIVNDAQDIDPDLPFFGGLTFPANPGHLRVLAQTARIFITTNATDDVLFQSAPLEFVERVNYTVLIMNADDGGIEIVRLRDGA